MTARKLMHSLILVSIAGALFLACCDVFSSEALAAPSWLQVGQPVPAQFAFSGEVPSMEELREAFIRRFGTDPSKWPDEFRRIHETQVAFNKRALASSKFQGQFGREALDKIRVQAEDPVGYWVRSLYDGWGFEEWFNHDHLTVQRVPRALLGRFLNELFPLMWRDIRSIIHVQELMLGFPDAKFVPYNSYDGQVLHLRKRDVLEYNGLIEKAANKYIRENDFLMLLLMPERIDTNWVGDAGLEASLVSRAKKLSGRIQDVVRNMDRSFRESFYKAVPRLTYSWNEEPWSENHVVLDGKPKKRSANVDLLGVSTRIEHPFIGEKTTVKDQKILSGAALKLQWGTAPVHSSEFDKGAVVAKISSRYMIAKKQYGESKEFVLSLYLDHVSGFGHEVAFTPADGPPYPEGIGEEIMNAVTAAFFEAAETLYGKSSMNEPQALNVPGTQVLGPASVRKVLLKPPKEKRLNVIGDEPRGSSFTVSVWDGRKKFPHAEVSVRKPEVGSLSSKNATGGDEKWLFITTGPLGDAEVVYDPPSNSELKTLGPIQWDVVIVVEDTLGGEGSSLTLKVIRPRDIDITAEHAVLPADPSFANPVRFRFDGKGPGSDPSERFRIKIRALSGMGVLSTKRGDIGGRSTLALEIEADREHELFYRWLGDRKLKGPVAETLLFEVPELEIKGSVTFSVGVAPYIHSPQGTHPDIKQPGLFIPLKVYVQDEYHPDLDMAAFLKAFGLKPVLDIRQVSFEPVESDGSKSSQILEAILQHIKGAELPRDVQSLEPESWSLVKESGSRWFIAGDTPGGDYSSENVIPGVIPWEYGDYTFRISMNLEDTRGVSVEPLRRTMTSILHVRPFAPSSGDGQADLILPLILAFSAIFPGEDTRQFAAKSRNLLQKGDFEAVSVALGEQFSQRLSWSSISDLANAADRERLVKLVAKAHGISGASLSEDIVNESIFRTKRNFLCAVAGVYAESFLSGGYDLSRLAEGPSSGANGSEVLILEMIKCFLEGYGEYGIVALTNENIRSLEVYTESGERLTEFPGQVFGGGDDSRRIFNGKHSVVIPFRLGENLMITLRGNGEPVDAIKILPNGINVQRYGFRPGSETINVYGDVVRP
ncbi:MAG: hypothetical protein Q7I97_06335 [Thermovirgaceae bacterium]|nr:hypothetical protein [Thermovirgaceae bacterium]